MPPTFTKDLTESLKKGLSPSANVEDNAPYMIRLVNHSPYNDGLRPILEIQSPFTDEVEVDFPLPQVFKGRKGTWLLGKDEIFAVQYDKDISEFPTYDYVDTEASATIVAGGLWHFIDLYDSVIFFNGRSIVFKDRAGLLSTSPMKVCSNIKIGTGCYFRGRILTGGFSSARLWTETWKDMLESLKARLPAELDSLSVTLDTNFVIASSIGSSDLAFRWLLYPEEAMTGYLPNVSMNPETFKLGKTPLANAIEKNELALIPMPFKGSPLVIKPIGGELSGEKGGVMVYGEEGVVALLPYSDPISTFGIRRMLGVGVKGRGAVGGDDFEHIFIDTLGCLWKLKNDFSLAPLGYEQYFKDMKNIIITFKETQREREYYICNDEKGYTLTQNGLGERTELITSLYESDGEYIGVKLDLAEQGGYIETGILDAEVDGLKKVQRIEVTRSGEEIVQVALQHRQHRTGIFRQTNWVKVNDRGWAHIGVTCEEFKILIRSRPKACKIERLKYTVQYVDRRNMGGPNAAASNS